MGVREAATGGVGAASSLVAPLPPGRDADEAARVERAYRSPPPAVGVAPGPLSTPTIRRSPVALGGDFGQV